jgi:3-methyladenine DNA glycosylase AlkD
MSANSAKVLAELRRLANPTNVAGMARFGIVGKELLGISMVQLRAIAKQIGRDHELAEELWASGVFEARILTGFVAEPARVTRRQANSWAKDFECWAIAMACVSISFVKPNLPTTWRSPGAAGGRNWSSVPGFTMMATLAVHDKAAGQRSLRTYLGRVQEEATDERHNVKKGVNWALRQIGKRNPILNREAILTAKAHS